MALLDKVTTSLKRNAQGQLVEEVNPLQKLAQERGQQIPMTPLGASMAGANPDQQKMVGVPNQKQAAIRINNDQTTTTAEAAAAKQYKQPQSQQQQSITERAKELAATLADTHGQVGTYIANAMQQMAPPPAPGLAAPTPADPAQQQVVTGAFSAAQSLLTSGRAVNDPAVVTEINKLMAATGLTADQLTQQLTSNAQSGTSGAGQAAAGAVQNSVSVGNLLPQLDTSAGELASLLGVPEAEIAGMSLDQLSLAIESLGQQTGVSGTQQASTSQALGQAERAGMREMGREQSASGARTTADSLGQLSQSVAAGDRVQFGGQEYTTEQLLADDNISRLVSDYLLNPESPEAKRLTSDPASKPLVAFAEKYRDSLTQAAQQMGQAVGAAQSISTANQKLGTFANGSQLAPELMSAIYGDTQSGPTQLTRTGLLQTIDSFPEAEQQQVVSQVNALVSKLPWAAKELSESLTPQAIRNLNKNNTWAEYGNSLTQRKQLEEIGEGNIDALVDMWFGDDTNINDISARLRENRSRAQLGLPSSDMRAIDANNDGKLDSFGNIRSRLTNSNNTSLRDALAGNPVSKSGPEGDALPGNTVQEKVFSTLMGSRGLAPTNLPKLGLEELRYVTQQSGPLAKQAGEVLAGKQQKLLNETIAGATDEKSLRALIESSKNSDDFSPQQVKAAIAKQQVIDKKRVADADKKAFTAAEAIVRSPKQVTDAWGRKSYETPKLSAEQVKALRSRGWKYHDTQGWMSPERLKKEPINAQRAR